MLLMGHPLSVPARARSIIEAGEHRLVVLDEVTYPVNWGWVDLDEVSFPVMVWMALLGLGLVLLFVAHRSIQRRDIQQD